jgi:hypothetical protein
MLKPDCRFAKFITDSDSYVFLSGPAVFLSLQQQAARTVICSGLSGEEANKIFFQGHSHEQGLLNGALKDFENNKSEQRCYGSQDSDHLLFPDNNGDEPVVSVQGSNARLSKSPESGGVGAGRNRSSLEKYGIAPRISSSENITANLNNASANASRQYSISTSSSTARRQSPSTYVREPRVQFAKPSRSPVLSAVL